MDKFLIKRPANPTPAPTIKRPAANPTSAPTKKAKSCASAQGSATWAKVRSIPVPGAAYQDQTLQFATLNDGRELLIGEEVWAIPPGASGASPAALKSLEQAGKMAGDRFASLPGLDAAAVVVGSGFGGTQRLSLCGLPDGCEILKEVPLPGRATDCNYGGAGFIKRLHSASCGVTSEAGGTMVGGVTSAGGVDEDGAGVAGG